MGQLADAEYDFSWRRINGVRTMRIFSDSGTELVKCFSQDYCPRLFNVTQDTETGEVEDSTSDPEPVPPVLFASK